MTMRHPSIIYNPDRVSMLCRVCNHIVYVGSECSKTGQRHHRENRAFESHNDAPSKTESGHVWD